MAGTMLRVALLQAFPADAADRIRELAAHPLIDLTIVGDNSAASRQAALSEAHYAIVLGQPLTAADLAAAPSLRLVHKWGAGTDGLDTAALAERGLPLLRTAGANAPFVAELALTLILSCLRNVPLVDRSLRAGVWNGPEQYSASLSLFGKTVGLVGLGAIGSALARLLAPFGCDVVYSARRQRAADVETALDVRRLPLEELLRVSDVVSLHVPLTPETRGLIDAAALRRR